MADIRSLPGVTLSTLAFLEKMKEQVPTNAPVMVLWVNEDGSPEMRVNNALRRDMTWCGHFLMTSAMISEFHEKARKP